MRLSFAQPEAFGETVEVGLVLLAYRMVTEPIGLGDDMLGQRVVTTTGGVGA